MTLKGRGYTGRCKFKFKWNSTDCKDSEVITRKMTDEELIKYGIKKDDDKDNVN